MSTRSLTRVRWESKSPAIVCMYRHCDGYPSGHGLDLATWLAGKVVGNGARNGPNYFNGIEHLAARMVAYFSDLHPNSNIYLVVPAETRAEEYNYEIYLDSKDRILMEASGYDSSFVGFPADYPTWLAKEEAAED